MSNRPFEKSIISRLDSPSSGGSPWVGWSRRTPRVPSPPRRSHTPLESGRCWRMDPPWTWDPAACRTAGELLSGSAGRARTDKSTPEAAESSAGTSCLRLQAQHTLSPWKPTDVVHIQLWLRLVFLILENSSNHDQQITDTRTGTVKLLRPIRYHFVESSNLLSNLLEEFKENFT